MTSIYAASSPTTFQTLHTHLLTLRAPLLPPNKPHDPHLSDAISSLYLHPTIEALLHLLNQDLPSAHFLVRHMQNAPAYEGMFAHGILHRIEGDYDNSRAWYADVCLERGGGFERVWGVAGDEECCEVGLVREEDEDDDCGGSSSKSMSKDKGKEKKKKLPAQKRARDFIDAIETFKKTGKGDKEALEGESRREIETLLMWCVEKFRTGKCLDARGVWVEDSEEVKKIGESMLTGGEGFRKF